MKKILPVITLMLILLISNAGFSQSSPTIQAVHAIADPGLEIVDVYASIGPIVLAKLEDLRFRQAIDTIPGVAGIPLDLGLAPGDSDTLTDVIKSINITLQNNKTYLGVGAGVQNPANFAPNPDGKNIGLELYFIDNARLNVSTAGNVEFLVMHAVTDAPTVDVRLQGGATLVDNLAYGEFSGYTSVAPGTYTLEVTDASGAIVVGVFEANLNAFANQTLIVVASGFLNPAQNQNGQKLGLYASNIQGQTVEFTDITVGIGDGADNLADSYELAQNYPNPFNPTTQISYRLQKSSDVKLTIYNLVGQEVKTLISASQAAGSYTVVWDGTNQLGAPVTSGVYLYQLQTPAFSQTRKMMLIK